MRIGLIQQLHRLPVAGVPRWEAVRDRARTAEAVGFDVFVYEDVLMYKAEDDTYGCWESMTMSGAIAASTETIRFGQSVVNSPYRSPAMTAVMAETLNEISGGRYVLGIGAGNSPQSDYEGFGFPTDKRYSRFAEAIEILHTLLTTGSADFDGDFYRADGAVLDLRGPSPTGPNINIAAGGPKMLRLVARYAHAWNWWGYDETTDQALERLRPIVAELEAACEEVGRDPAEIERTLDVYSVVPPGLEVGDTDLEHPVTGTVGDIAEYLLRFRELGVEEIRVDLTDKSAAGVEAMAPVVDRVHAG